MTFNTDFINSDNDDIQLVDDDVAPASKADNKQDWNNYFSLETGGKHLKTRIYFLKTFDVLLKRHEIYLHSTYRGIFQRK